MCPSALLLDQDTTQSTHQLLEIVSYPLVEHELVQRLGLVLRLHVQGSMQQFTTRELLLHACNPEHMQWIPYRNMVGSLVTSCQEH